VSIVPREDKKKQKLKLNKIKSYNSNKPKKMERKNKNVQQGISIFSDPTKWSTEELVNFVERILTNDYTDHNSSELMRISQSLRNQV